jgi:hypothetical protein
MKQSPPTTTDEPWFIIALKDVAEFSKCSFKLDLNQA